MKARIAVLLLFLPVWCVSGRAQTVTPSITIGTHVLTLGMPESSELEQLGTDLQVYPIQDSGLKDSGSNWIVSQKRQTKDFIIADVHFDASHHLASAAHSWDIEKTSSKSLFDAINEATKSLERDGRTACHLSTYGTSERHFPAFDPEITGILIDCGIKKATIELLLSDSSIEVMETLGHK
jgi:hypothetical protein